MIKILTIQFRTNIAAIAQEQRGIQRELGEGVVVDYLSALDTGVAWQSPERVLAGYHGLILGGSGDLDFDGNRPADDEVRQLSLIVLRRLQDLFRYLFDHDVPTLGICYGHQILGAFAGAQVRYDERQKKVCSHQLQVVVDKNEHLILSDLPATISAHYGHKDVLDRVPEGAVLLMTGGSQCQVSALRYKKNIYTVQFHPELRFVDIVERVKSSGYLPEGVRAEEVFQDDPNSHRLLYNFGQLVIGSNQTIKA
jgi:GMP synthase-like glutamine amidotransferase